MVLMALNWLRSLQLCVVHKLACELRLTPPEDGERERERVCEREREREREREGMRQVLNR